MITTLNNYFPHIGFILIALILGMRHGLDFDHLAIIDSMTRRLPEHHKLSRFVGVLFSLGHGIVVILFCICINIFFKAFALPVWLDRVMFGLSISFLIVFGSINIYSLLKPTQNSKQKIFLAKRIFQSLKIPSVENPLNIIFIGAIFAVSFDTVSQIALFSLNINHFLNVFFPILLGITFMFGMMLTDGINGYAVAFLLRKSKKLSFSLSRLLTLCIGLFSTTVGFIEILSLIQGGT
jgi:high-affinity nickel-transport protein